MALIHAYVYGKVDEIQNEFQITGADVFIMPKLELTNMVVLQDYLAYVDELRSLFAKYCDNGCLVMPNLTRSYVGIV